MRRNFDQLAIKEWNSKTPSSSQFEEAVKRIESALIDRFKKLRDQGLEIDFNMILVSVDHQGKASMYLFDRRGLAEPVHDNPGFAVIGTGFITGGNLLLRLLGYSPEESYGLDLGALSTFIIDVVSEIDPAVGPFIGESYYMGLKEGKVELGVMGEEYIKEFKEKARQRKELIRKIWRLSDSVGEQKVATKIEELEKEEQNTDHE
ncbi:MAG: hypothetical protein DSO07_01270 [Thermoproteota archaeon]|nr:MAG: hypothetical protein DSO07_01270 [Candidatus Korarchaeota archaeon]